MLTLTACSSDRIQRTRKAAGAETTIQTDSLYISTKGPETTICDIIGGHTYKLTTRRKKAGNGTINARTIADTDTMKITVCGSEISIADQTTGTLYTIRKRR